MSTKTISTDIAFASGATTASFSEPRALLTVTDGAHTAEIKLAGNHLASAWTLSSNGRGGTTVFDSPAGARSGPPRSRRPWPRSGRAERDGDRLPRRGSGGSSSRKR
ncbi:MAG TPA: hypothetical protein VG166_11425 [Caulobacteraceae bacterium]|nr:hypothetical protein [Caulobacteraceae bacterium]